MESFLGDVLALAGEDPDAVRDGVRVALAKCEAIFRLQKRGWDVPGANFNTIPATVCRPEK